VACRQVFEIVLFELLLLLIVLELTLLLLP
jgi:hypothetical protein